MALGSNCSWWHPNPKKGTVLTKSGIWSTSITSTEVMVKTGSSQGENLPAFEKSSNEEQQMSPGRKWSRLLRYAASSVGTVTLLLKVRSLVLCHFSPNSAKQIIVGALPIAGLAADKAGLKVGTLSR
jgi:hypothetical protein